MPEISKNKILDSRKAADAYRTAHTKLYSKGWHKGIPEEHTPLLNTMKAGLKKKGFNSLDEFFSASELDNIQELGFVDRTDFEAKITELNKDAERHIKIDEEGKSFEVIRDTPEAKQLREALDGKWH